MSPKKKTKNQQGEKIIVKLPTELLEFKNKLEQERKDLLKQIKKLNEPVEFGNDVDDVDEEAAETEVFANKISESEIMRLRLNEIDYLINKINKGEYGVCDNCGKKIDPKELKQKPELIFCSVCKTKKNKKNK